MWLCLKKGRDLHVFVTSKGWGIGIRLGFSPSDYMHGFLWFVGFRKLAFCHGKQMTQSVSANYKINVSESGT